MGDVGGRFDRVMLGSIAVPSSSINFSCRSFFMPDDFLHGVEVPLLSN